MNRIGVGDAVLCLFSPGDAMALAFGPDKRGGY